MFINCDILCRRLYGRPPPWLAQHNPSTSFITTQDFPYMKPEHGLSWLPAFPHDQNPIPTSVFHLCGQIETGREKGKIRQKSPLTLIPVFLKRDYPLGRTF